MRIMSVQSLEAQIRETFAEVFRREGLTKEMPELHESSALMQTGLDSLGFAVLVVELEDALGFDPFALSEDAYYPETFGDFVRFYELNKPS